MTPGLVTAAPLRLEARALRAGGLAPVLRVGMGARRSRAAGLRLAGQSDNHVGDQPTALGADRLAGPNLWRGAQPPADPPAGSGSRPVVGAGPGAAGPPGPADAPLAIAGTAAGLLPGLTAGSVVVATEVRGPAGRLALPGAELVAAALRARGLVVHLGPIVTVDRLVFGRERRRLAATGALAADLESYHLAGPALRAGRPVALVRTISDGAGSSTGVWNLPRGGLAALAALRQAASGIQEWASACGPHAVLLASPRSFCAGVERAVEIVERALERAAGPVYVRRQIVHNAHVVADLESRGAVFVTELDEVPAGQTVVLSAHGVAPIVRQQAVTQGLTVIDATCPLVAKVHAEARRYAERGYTVALIGHAGHEEVEGTLGELGEAGRLVTSPADVARLEVEQPARVAYLMQTTLAVDEAEDTAAAIREHFPSAIGPDSDDICYATSNRQAAVRAVAEQADVVLVLGSQNSSNSLRLVEVAERAGARAHLVEDAESVRPAWLVGAATIGVTAGASAPGALVDQVVQAIGGLGPMNLSEHAVTTENVRFTLPKEVH